MNNERPAYEKPTVSSHTEAELLASIEVWGASGSSVIVIDF